jgi:hypothetical protein
VRSCQKGHARSQATYLACPFDSPSNTTVNIQGTSCQLTVRSAFWLPFTWNRFDLHSKENHFSDSTCIASIKLCSKAAASRALAGSPAPAGRWPPASPSRALSRSGRQNARFVFFFLPPCPLCRSTSINQVAQHRAGRLLTCKECFLFSTWFDLRRYDNSRQPRRRPASRTVSGVTGGPSPAGLIHATILENGPVPVRTDELSCLAR